MLKILTPFLLIAACIGLPATASNVVEEAISIGDASRIHIYSKAQEQNRHLLVHLPDSYTESNKPYPVLYLIDGGRHFNHAIISTQLLQQQQRVPELIIVAIANNDNMDHDPDRGKEKFTRFVKNEVMSYVDENYRTTGLNTLFGHTKAGWLTIELLASHPELFKNYISASAPLQYDEVDIYNKILANSKTEQTPEKSLYFTLSNEAEESKLYSDAFNNFVKLLTANPPKNLDWRYEFLANHTHMTTSIPALYNGMTHVFSSYQAPRFASYNEYMDFGGMHGMEAHYQKRANIYGTDKNIPENTLLNLASLLLNEGKTEAALQVYSQLTNDFPESAASFSGLGQVYNAMKQYDKSITAHRKAVRLAEELNPEWQQKRFQSRLDTVKKERND
ncbi:alpha/beta hydrolase-fold protein [Thalassotalea fonticola]|uniref:Alpha/beta hydrolase-fold protein n=1 Tax=Thalassotalea fonticola TaxID=3065649 RepID=A0ABZ0GKD0_9GAMM|nr:alpha/beta hydrolase-fold protein [Colwelliaceae bacterium S1-1]